ncbi:uncharacterized protein LOC119333791 [Triticum dicoccoides]|uniref:uncharacterized protein LOC119333791 n=1 Tax=Triticum dicoccoides TaxID=85692 RepID=UPI00189114A8|nr:uncharacterized protein LOC119333791 [Triticum dicoccoides]
MATLCWSVDVKGGEAVRSCVLDGRRGAVTSVSLVGPPSGRSVVVEAYVKTASGTLALASLSSEGPRVELPRSVLVMESDFFCSRVRRHGDGGDPAGDEAVAVRFEGRFNDHVLPPPPLCEGLENEDDDDDNSEPEDEYSVDSEDEEDGSSSEEEEDEEESDGEVDGQAASADDDVTLGILQTLHRRKFVPEGQLVGGSAPRFACAGRTLGFMRVAAVESEGGDDSKHILVLYRYTRFRASPDGVERRGRTTEHQLRFIATGDHTARSLAWAGSSLGLLIYPDISSKKLEEITKQLQELWSILASQVSVPPGARRVEVFVDVGILRRADYTPASMGHMYAALESMVADPWPGRFIGMELPLPVPVRCGTEGELAGDDDRGRNADERPAKRRRVDVAGEDCPVCLQLLEGDDLAAWPGCRGKPHVFHGACLEGVLQNRDICPMCRHKLDIKHKLE